MRSRSRQNDFGNANLCHRMEYPLMYSSALIVVMHECAVFVKPDVYTV